MLVAPVTLADAPILHRLMNDPAVLAALLEMPTTLCTWRNAIATWREDPDEEDFVIWTTAGGGRVGWIGVNGLRSAEGMAWIKMLAVVPEAWGMGYASAAIRWVKGWLAGQGFPLVALWTDAGNGRARRCYERNGFVVAAREWGTTGPSKIPGHACA